MPRNEPLTASELEAMEQRARRWGSANCWTGTGGSLAADVLMLVHEVRRLAVERDRATMALASLTTDDGGT